MADTEYLRLNRIGLCVAGAWVDQKFDSSFVNILYRSYGILVVCLFACFNLSQFLEMFLVKDDIELLVENSGITLVYFSVVVKLINIRLRGERISRILQRIRAEQVRMQNANKEKVKIYEQYKNYNNLIIKSLLLLCVFATVWYVTSKLMEYFIGGPQEKYNNKVPLVFETWYPFDKYADDYYAISYTLQMTFAIMCTGLVPFVDSFFLSLMTFGTAQLKLLQDSIKNLHIAEDENGNILETDDTVIIDCYDKIVDVIRHHSRIVEYFQDIGDYISPILFMQFLTYSLTACVVFLDGIVANTPSRIISDAIASVGLLVELFTYYWHANEVTFESSQITKAVGECKWYMLSARVKLALLILMARSHTTIVMSVSGVHTMSLDSYTAMVKSAYTFLTMFRQMYGR